jgi:hypothetical protein
MRDGPAQSLAGPMLLVALGVARMLRLVLHDPVLGYADNFDFHRTASWYGWVPLAPSSFRGSRPSPCGACTPPRVVLRGARASSSPRTNRGDAC